jgi:hypothetical protein
MIPHVVQVGPLVAPSATNIAAAQSPAAAGYLALNGSTSSPTANNICLSQSGTAGKALLINGALAQTQYSAPTLGLSLGKIAHIPSLNMHELTRSATTNAFSPNNGQPIYITSAGNDSTNTFTVTGYVTQPGTTQPILTTETITGTNGSIVASANSYTTILSITPTNNTGAAVTIGTTGMSLLDKARRVLFTSSGTDTGLTITITGTDWAQNIISESLTGGSSGSPVYTVNDYLTVQSVKVSGATAGTMSIGTNQVASSPWINNDLWAAQALTGQCVVSGTVNYTVQVTMDDPNSYSNSFSPPIWDSSISGVVSATASTTFAAQPGAWTRLLLNSNTNPGYVRMTIGQFGAVPY